jgi:hypothetical protein
MYPFDDAAALIAEHAQMRREIRGAEEHAQWMMARELTQWAQLDDLKKKPQPGRARSAKRSGLSFAHTCRNSSNISGKPSAWGYLTSR